MIRRHLLAVTVVIAICALAAPAGAAAAKVTETAPGVTLPNASGGGANPTVQGEASQSFELKGRKVRKRQVLDVNVILNAASGTATTSLGDVRVTLVGPKGDNIDPFFNAPDGQVWADLKLDDQSNLFPCNPAFVVGGNCNYLQGGTFTGSIHAEFNATFRGLNPKGTWQLLFRDVSSSVEGPTAIGVSTLEVKTGRKFEKD